MRSAFEKGKERFYKAFKLMVELTNKMQNKEKADEVFEICLKYLLDTKDDIEIEEMEKVAKEESVEMGELIMSIAEKLKLEERKEVAVKLLTKRFGKEFSKELQSKILKADKKTIDYIMDNLLEITLEELKEILK